MDKKARATVVKAVPILVLVWVLAVASIHMARHPRQLQHAKTKLAAQNAALLAAKIKPALGPALHHQEETILLHVALIEVKKEWRSKVWVVRNRGGRVAQ